MKPSTFRIQKYTAKSQSVWEPFALSHGTIFHRRQFLRYHPASRFQDYSLLIRKQERLCGIFPAAAQREVTGTWLISHPGTTFGSLAVNAKFGIQDIHETIQVILRYAKKKGFAGIKIVQPPIIYQHGLSEDIEFCLRIAGFKYVRQELSSVLEMRRITDQTAFKPSVNQAVRKAEREGVSVCQTNDINAFYAVLLKNLSLRHHVAPTHTLRELKRLQKLLPDDILLFGAYVQNKLVGGIVLFLTRHQSALAYYITHDMDYQHLRVADLLMVQVISWCSDEGYRYLDFGTFTQEMKPNWGLGKFKEKFGAKGLYRNTLARTL